MEMLETTTSIRELRLQGSALTVEHGTTDLTRGLEPGETVLVKVDGELHSATVSGIDFTLEDTVYEITVGGRVPAELAQERRGVMAPTTDAGVHQVVDLLAALRRRQAV